MEWLICGKEHFTGSRISCCPKLDYPSLSWLAIPVCLEIWEIFKNQTRTLEESSTDDAIWMYVKSHTDKRTYAYTRIWLEWAHFVANFRSPSSIFFPKKADKRDSSKIEPLSPHKMRLSWMLLWFIAFYGYYCQYVSCVMSTFVHISVPCQRK